MKNKKAAGLDEITPELLKTGGQTIISTLTTLLNTWFLMNGVKGL